MSKSTAHTVCRLCGGSGLPQHPVVVARSLRPCAPRSSARRPTWSSRCPNRCRWLREEQMDKHLWLSLLRLVDEGSAEELQAKKEELLQSLERLRITRGPVRSDVLRVVRLIDEELVSRLHLEQRRKGRR